MRPADELAAEVAAVRAECARLRAELAATEGVEAQLEALRRQHRELEARAQVLERANAALEHFAYAASHDLQAPLRAIAHFATWIEEDLPPEASEVVRMYVGRLRDRVERMTCLQEKLLDYARINGQRPEIEAVDVGELVRDVWCLVMPPQGYTIALEAEEGRRPIAAEPLRTVLRNLFTNTIAHHDRGGGHVLVTVHSNADTVIVEVADDGPGVPPEEAERIFRATFVLRPDGRSTGMGLAIARRHAEHVGGAVYLVPSPGRGARFRVEWPIDRNTPRTIRPADRPSASPSTPLE